MGAVEERFSLSQQTFEELARVGELADEALRLEFIEGKIREKPLPDGDHGRIIMWLLRLFVHALPELALFPEQGLRVETYRQGNARPDACLAPLDHFVGQGEWADPDGVRMVVEVTSYDHDTERRDRVEKPRAYARTGIPVYLLIDRDSCEVKVFSEPEGERYARTVTVPIGKTVTLPDPVGVELDTEPLTNWVR